jgi:putative ABC transport system permease protein
MSTGSSRTRAAVRVYAIAVSLAARPLRARYADEMQETFALRAAEASRRSAWALAALTVRELLDLARCAVRLRAPSTRYHVRRSNRMTSIVQDIRYAVRLLRRQPSFALVAIVTLALGVGATTAVFTVVSGVLLRPLPYANPERLVVLLNGRAGRLTMSFSPLNFRDASQHSGVFVDAAAINASSLNLTDAGEPQRLDGRDVTWSFFSVLGVTPRLGRAFVERDTAEGQHVVVISDSLWRRLGSRADIVGTTLRLDAIPHSVVGVMPPGTIFMGRSDYWRPLVFTPHQLDESQRGAQWVNAVARVKPGVSLAQANAALATVANRLQAARTRNFGDRQFASVLLHERIVRDVRPALMVLLGAVGMLLLIACVNVANLLLARAYGRTRELAVRTAVGAGRLRLVQQLLAESLVLGSLGAAAGLVVAAWATRALVAIGPDSIPRIADIAIDWRVLSFTIAVTTVTSVLFGLVPAVGATGAALAGRGTIGHAGGRLRKTLVAAELAMAVMLLVGAGLLIRSYQRISDVNPGFSPDHVLTFRIALPGSKYATPPAVAQFATAFTERLGRNGVTAAAVLGLPLDEESSASSSFTRPGEMDRDDSPSLGMRVATPNYFDALRIPLRRGRTFDTHDTDTSPEVAIINEEAAKRYWPGQDPLGRQLHLGARLTRGVRSGMKTIVGVVGDVKYGGLDTTAQPEIFLPFTQHPVDSFTIVVRTQSDPLAFVPAARAELSGIDRELPISAVRSMDEVVGVSIAQRRFLMMLLGAFAATAVALAVIGVYGVLAYLVSQRTQEIGVRLALGAAPGDVVRLFVREGLALGVVGLAAGAAGALGIGRALTTLLFGVTPTDPTTFAVVALALASAALGASYLPARRASRVDPMAALRVE